MNRKARRLQIDPNVIDPFTFKKIPKAVQFRRTFGIGAYVGKNGSGKTLSMVRDVLPDLDAGIPVLGTLALISPETAPSVAAADLAWANLGVSDLKPLDRPLALPHPLWTPLKSFYQLDKFRDGTVMLDEIQGVADSRDQGLPAEVRNRIFKLRARNCRFLYTTIDYSAVDKRVRQVTKVLTFCKGQLPLRAPGQIWGANRLFYYRTFDPDDFLDFTEAWNRTTESKRPKVVKSQWSWINKDLLRASQTYCTTSPVLAIGSSAHGSKCLECGKKRKLEYCEGHSS